MHMITHLFRGRSLPLKTNTIKDQSQVCIIYGQNYGGIFEQVNFILILQFVCLVIEKSQHSTNVSDCGLLAP